MPGLPLTVLKTLAYFDLFHHPLTMDEIMRFSESAASETDFCIALDYLLSKKLVFQLESFYSLHNDPLLIGQRISRQIHAAELLDTAARVGRLLFRFPFVRAVAVSGSLSKHCADARADIDLFIVTSANRLWICRTILHAVKKISFITGHQHWFCMNYFIDEQALEIREKNLFTATELFTLIPVQDEGVMKDFYSANRWAAVYLPFYKQQEPDILSNTKSGLFKRMLEFIFVDKIAGKLDKKLERVTISRWKKKEEEFRLNIKGERMGLDGGRHYAKPNPIFFQTALLSRYQQAVSIQQARLNTVSRTYIHLRKEIIK